jgi:ABC-2 type transport system permease protein
MTTVTPIAMFPAGAALPRPIRSAGLLGTSLMVARRSLLRGLRSPHVFMMGMTRGAIFLLIFRYVFGGAISSGIRYVDFLVPGFVAVGVLFSGMTSATAVAEDVGAGLFDRLRSLPVSRLGIVAGRVIADTTLAGLGIAVTIAVGFAVGFRSSASLAELLAAVGLCLVAAFAFTWVFVTLGLVAGSPHAAQGMALLVFPIAFVSSAFVPVESMPGWMQAFAEHQPLTHLVNATRAFAVGESEAVLGHSAGYFAIRALLWCVAITLIFAPLAATRYQRD